jgi:hypothetical protein
MSYLLPPLLEAVASGLSARYAALAPEGLAPEALAQYFLDLSWLDGTLSAAGGLGWVEVTLKVGCW